MGLEDTIVALATALGVGGVHIVRLSGDRAGEIIEKCFEPVNSERWRVGGNYTLHLGWFKEGGVAIDQVLIGKMLSPASYTGEDVYEVNCHGGVHVALRILRACLRLGAREAEAGEFTKRAFLRGKLDLAQAEAVVDVIAARTDSAGELATSQLAGVLSRDVQSLREFILETLAFLEAGIDFPEDEVEALDRAELKRRLMKSKEKAEAILEGSGTGKILREGLITVICGRPNAGKSSLMNALLKEERAIVTDLPGTTRDEIRESASLGGVLLHLVDTAGLRQGEGEAERLGIERAWQALARADLILLVTVAGEAPAEEERKVMSLYGDRVVVLRNKTDLLPGRRNSGVWGGATGENDDIDEPFRLSRVGGDRKERRVCLNFSVREGYGFDDLEREIKRRVYGAELSDRRPVLSNVRHITAMERCRESLVKALAAVDAGYPWDIVTVDLRESLRQVSSVTGDSVDETLINDIFNRFCIGK
ncbi:tRNA modification GTPase MnmE domain 2 [Acididesulfobacillus acetoxydans]|uniref:tRNA modification GTPase MnmE n=1 Tax=Acididesulfobacillus acetoxydans TaxID=1561005 RepID=A0A8S0XUX2_9FIRM|nr:tRNA uridine-5-carboxymethylaminomethyl(34) synthesis GTPase MnmE [Acididesulfobacillus acetoxydans]CAA7599817.1 tRNA modification GTPase MnmE domain 2 [Acididesulfobacillus acetoxydans]CEJ07383.1 tRNA modification GTPase MnmE [Acididesulfobacillus acetoxydans]